MSTGFGRPVVPEVKLTMATSASWVGPPLDGVRDGHHAPPSSTVTTGTVKRPARSPVVTATTGWTCSMTWVISVSLSRGLTGTYTAPTRHAANRATTIPT